jgi:uncharacterized membrane protein
MNFPWRTLLVASLSINMLIVGAGIGFVASGTRLRPPMFAQQPAQRQAFLRALTPQERMLLVDDLNIGWRQGEADRQAAAQARQDLLGIATREPYDEAAVRKALGQVRADDMAVLERYQDALATALGKLPAAKRAEALRAAGRAAPLRQMLRNRSGDRLDRLPPPGGPPSPDGPR